MTPTEKGRTGGIASGKKATERRLAKWLAEGINPVVGQKIYEQGYIAGYVQRRREQQKAATA